MWREECYRVYCTRWPRAAPAAAPFPEILFLSIQHHCPFSLSLKRIWISFFPKVMNIYIHLAVLFLFIKKWKEREWYTHAFQNRPVESRRKRGRWLIWAKWADYLIASLFSKKWVRRWLKWDINEPHWSINFRLFLLFSYLYQDFVSSICSYVQWFIKNPTHLLRQTSSKQSQCHCNAQKIYTYLEYKYMSHHCRFKSHRIRWEPNRNIFSSTTEAQRFDRLSI